MRLIFFPHLPLPILKTSIVYEINTTIIRVYFNLFQVFQALGVYFPLAFGSAIESDVRGIDDTE